MRIAYMNPLHADPEVAARAGFAQPILHGLGTFGIAGFALLQAVLDYDQTRLRAMDVRFTAPVPSGELSSTTMISPSSAFARKTSVSDTIRRSMPAASL